MSKAICKSVGGKFFLNDFEIVQALSNGTQASAFKAFKDGYYFAVLISDTSFQVRINYHKLFLSVSGVCRYIADFVRPEQLPIIAQHRKLFGNILSAQYILVLQFCGDQNITQQRDKMNNEMKIRIMQRLAYALDAFHRNNVYHLDIKPDNVTILDGHPYIIDLGSMQTGQDCEIVDPIQPGHFKQIFPFQITERFSYLNPRDSIHFGGPFDCYSYGCVLYFLFVGKYVRAPIDPMSVEASALVAKLGIDVADLIIRLLSKDQFMRLRIDEVLQHIVFTGRPILRCAFDYQRVRRDCFVHNLRKGLFDCRFKVQDDYFRLQKYQLFYDDLQNNQVCTNDLQQLICVDEHTVDDDALTNIVIYRNYLTQLNFSALQVVFLFESLPDSDSDDAGLELDQFSCQYMFEKPKIAKVKKIDTSGFQLIDDINIDASSDVEYSEELSVEGEYYD